MTHRKALIAAAVGLALVGLAVALHRLPSQAAWGSARLGLGALLFIAPPAVLLVPFYLALGDVRRREHGSPVPLLTILCGSTLVFGLAPLLVAWISTVTAYEAEVVLLGVVWIWSLALGGHLMAHRKTLGPARPVVGGVRAWHAAVVALALLSVAAWPLAHWNPTLRHSAFALRVARVGDVSGVHAGARCKLLVGMYDHPKGPRCRVSFACDGRRLYGGFGRGVLPCRVSEDGSKVSGVDRGGHDPPLRIETGRGFVAFGRGLVARIDLEAQ